MEEGLELKELAGRGGEWIGESMGLWVKFSKEK